MKSIMWRSADSPVPGAVSPRVCLALDESEGSLVGDSKSSSASRPRASQRQRDRIAVFDEIDTASECAHDLGVLPDPQKRRRVSGPVEGHGTPALLRN